jgi:hypothetical protein
MVLVGHQQRAFPTFAFVVQNSFSFMTTQSLPEQFAPQGGAAALNSINFCPPTADPNGLNGNLNCPGYSNPGAGNYAAFMGIDQIKSPQTPSGTKTANAFGGTLRMGRHVTQAAVWFGKPPFCANPPDPSLGPGGCVQIVSRQPNSAPDSPWTPGQTNYKFVGGLNPAGPWYEAWLTTSKAQVSTLLDCTPLPCVPASPAPTIMAPGPNNPDDIAFGFKMTTGIVSGSDIYPPVGPNTPYFTFVSTGKDTISAGGHRNIVMIGGSIALSGASGQLFNRLNVLEISLAVPEPATSAALAAGMLGLLALARMRRSS